MPQLCKRVKMSYLSRFLLLIWQMNLLAYMKRKTTWVPVTAGAWVPVMAGAWVPVMAGAWVPVMAVAWVPVMAVAWVPVMAVVLEMMLLAN